MAALPESSSTGSLAHGHAASRFRGQFDYAVDDKGRLTLPPAFRAELVDGGNLVVLDGLAVIYDEAGYRRLVDHLNTLVPAGHLTAAQVGSFCANTHPVHLDAQGRVVVPHAVRVQAGLVRDVVVRGAGPRIEVVAATDAAMQFPLGIDDDVVDAVNRFIH